MATDIDNTHIGEMVEADKRGDLSRSDRQLLRRALLFPNCTQTNKERIIKVLEERAASKTADPRCQRLDAMALLNFERQSLAVLTAIQSDEVSDQTEVIAELRRKVIALGIENADLRRLLHDSEVQADALRDSVPGSVSGARLDAKDATEAPGDRYAATMSTLKDLATQVSDPPVDSGGAIPVERELETESDS